VALSIIDKVSDLDGDFSRFTVSFDDPQRERETTCLPIKYLLSDRRQNPFLTFRIDLRSSVIVNVSNVRDEAENEN